jgi:hypothetical protein
MVLFAVGNLRRNLRYEAQALQCPQRAHSRSEQPNGLPRNRLHPRPVGAIASHPEHRPDLVRRAPSDQAVADCSDSQYGLPERHMLWRITDNLRAKAIRALPTPRRLAIVSAQSLSGKARLTRVKMTIAAS